MKKQQLKTTTDFLKTKGFTNPVVGIVLGTGLGSLVNEVEIDAEISYSDIPNFPISTVVSHAGKLIYGTLSGKKVILMSGRFHAYEDYSQWEITYGIRVMKELGIKTLLISNAAGAINLNYKKGDLMLLDDQINLQGNSPLIFKGASEFGNIFTDMSEPYSKKINNQLKNIASENNIDLKEGIYAGVLGPQLETRAEYRMLQILEVDAVGMSTVPEVIVARSIHLPCVAISVLTDECNPKNLHQVDIKDIIAVAKKAEPKLILLFKELIRQL